MRCFTFPSVSKPAKKQEEPKARAWRPTFEDERLLKELQAKFGVRNEVEVLRISLRKLADAEGIR